jgi:hypothetical protein
MNKSQAIDLLNQIAYICESLTIDGFDTRPIGAIGADSVELRLIASLDFDSREKLNYLISSRGLKMQEEKGLVIIYEPHSTS